MAVGAPVGAYRAHAACAQSSGTAGLAAEYKANDWP